jgi:hypothetical protein
VTTDPVVQDMMLAFINAQHTTHGLNFRAFFASPDYVSSSEAMTLALGENSSYASLVTQPVVAASGVTELPPLYPAAMVCGMAAGALPTQPITKAILRCRSLPARAKYAKATRETMENNGVLVLREDKGRGVEIALAITTSLSDKRPERMLSESMVRDVIEQRIKAYVTPLIPHWAYIGFMPTVRAAVINGLESLRTENIISEGRDARNRILPAYLPPEVKIFAGIVRITLVVKIGGEISHIDVDGLIAYQLFEITLTPAA